MPNGKVYDPLVGQWMSPQWEGMMGRATEPQQLHLYRFNGNDPINVVPTRQYLKGTFYTARRPGGVTLDRGYLLDPRSRVSKRPSVSGMRAAPFYERRAGAPSSTSAEI